MCADCKRPRVLSSRIELNMAHAGHNLLLLFGGSSDELEASMISLCTSFYDLVLVDPVLALLFERRDVAMHARRLGLFLAMLCGGNTRYLRERCPLFAAGQSGFNPSLWSSHISACAL